MAMASILLRVSKVCQPGQVFISSGIYERIKHKLVCGYKSLGDRKLGGLRRPGEGLPRASGSDRLQQIPKATRERLIFLLSLVLLVIGGGALWYVFWQPHGKVGDRASAACFSGDTEGTLGAAA